MANYSYLARDDAGKQVKGVMSAESELDLANRFRKHQKKAFLRHA